MVNGIRASDHRELNKGRGSMFRVGSRVREETPEECRRKHRPKRCEYNNKDEDNSTKTLNDKNHQASSPKFRQLTLKLVEIRTSIYVSKFSEEFVSHSPGVIF